MAGVQQGAVTLWVAVEWSGETPLAGGERLEVVEVRQLRCTVEGEFRRRFVETERWPVCGEATAGAAVAVSWRR